jgi:hypothetical protein
MRKGRPKELAMGETSNGQSVQSGGETRDHFCNAKAGELIISHSGADAAANEVMAEIKAQKIEHVEYLRDMDEWLQGWEFTRPATMEYKLHLIRVPYGQESWKINYLQFLYKQTLVGHLQSGKPSLAFAGALARSDLHFIAQPNHLLELAAVAGGAALGQQPDRKGETAVRAADFRFSEFHNQYKSILNVPVRSDPALAQQYYQAAGDKLPVTISVLDTGVAADFAPKSSNVVATNLTDPERSGAVATDEHGHGTIMCKIISDIAPFAQLRVFKVWTHGAADEWDALAGLLLATKTPGVINISLTFGLQDVTCSECGRKSNLSRALTHSHASRSTVFENIIRLVVDAGSIVVAAAGNKNLDELAYPARFSHALAISSVTSRLKRSSFSNYGTLDSDNKPHENRFALPGGETEAPAEPIGSFGTDSRNMAGTSHGAAYATGVVAHLWQRAKPEERNPRTLIAAMREATESPDKNATRFSGYNAAEHGHGIPRL